MPDEDVPVSTDGYRYFSELDSYLDRHGYRSLDGLRNTISQIERRRLVYFVFLALLGLAVAAGMTAAALPVLMMWMVLVVFGTAFSTLGSVLRRRKRNRIANILRQWESEHPLRPMADAAYGDSSSPEAPFAIRWLAINRDESPFDWTHNYTQALEAVRSPSNGHPSDDALHA